MLFFLFSFFFLLSFWKLISGTVFRGQAALVLFYINAVNVCITDF